MLLTIDEVQTVTFATNLHKPLEIKTQEGKLWHLQTTSNKTCAVKFPFTGAFLVNCEVLGATSGVKLPKRLKIGEQDRFFNARLFHVVYKPDLQEVARIWYKEGKCEVGPKFYTFPIQWQEYILLHEKAHCFFSKELDADLWALNQFAQKGLNLSQAYYALENGLKKSAENVNRIKTIYSNIERITK